MSRPSGSKPTKSGRPDAESRARISVSRALKDLGELRGLLEKSLNVSIPSVPRLSSVADIKRFCGGLIESSPSHGWERRKIRYVRRSKCHYGVKVRERDFMTISFSLFLFRKTLPSPDADLDAYHDKLSTPKKVDEAFVSFCRQEIPRLFKPGWDRSYSDRVDRVIVGTKSFLEKEDKEDNTRLYVNRTMTRDEFITHCRDGIVFPGVRRVTVVFKAGKARIVTVASALQYCLSPLSGMMYDHISKKDWLLRGDAKPGKFSGFNALSSEVFVSGDYESATDNFCLGHSRAILASVLETSTLPVGVRLMATSSLSSVIKSRNRTSLAASGQLMGDKLSFPLLCLTNYLAFAYAMRPFGKLPPVRINGDDIVFRSTRAQADRWFEVVSSSGLVVSRGKTMVSGRYFSLNSSIFSASSDGVRQVPFIRSLPLFRPSEDSCLKLGGRMMDCSVGFRGESRLIVHRHFLRLNKGYLWKSQVSLARGHGVSFPDFLMRDLGIFEREQTYLSIPERFDGFPSLNRIVPGFVRVRIVTTRLARAVKSSRKDLMNYYRDLTWSEGKEVQSQTDLSREENKVEGKMAERCLLPFDSSPGQETGSSVPTSRGPIRYYAKILRKGVTGHGPYVHLFHQPNNLGRFMGPKTYHNIVNKASLGVRKGYIKEEKRNAVKEIRFVPGPVHPGTFGLM